jgi:hypothetical protein
MSWRITAEAMWLVPGLRFGPRRLSRSADPEAKTPALR